MTKVEWGNPYTHEEHSRVSWSWEELHVDDTCNWCGNRNRYNGLFSYNGDGELFCSKSCYETYHA